MRISVLVIAHNEERNIEKCIQSLLSQTKNADEIVLINHNSFDRTGEFARKYPIKVIDYSGPKGSVHARIKGFKEVTGDVVLCIDGDAYAAKNWVEVMTGYISKSGMVMVGSWVRLSGTAYNLLQDMWYFFCSSRGFKATDYLWGASLGLWGNDRVVIVHALEEGIRLSDELGLAYNPDDFWLALFMSERGGLEVTNKTWVRAYAKERTSLQMFRRGIIASGIRMRVHRFLKEQGLPRLRN